MEVSWQRLVPLSLLLASSASVGALLWSPSGFPRLSALAKERQGLEQEMRQLRVEIDQLRIASDAIKSSPESLERVARDELGLVRQTELVVHFEQ